MFDRSLYYCTDLLEALQLVSHSDHKHNPRLTSTTNTHHS